MQQADRPIERVSDRIADLYCPHLDIFLSSSSFVYSFAYIEFLDKASVDNALKLDDSLFKGRQLKVYI